MTQTELPIEPAFFEFDIERDVSWPMPPAVQWTQPKPALWERICERLDEAFGMGDVR